MTAFTLSLMEYYFIYPIIAMISANINCSYPTKVTMYAGFLTVIAINYLIYQQSGRSRKIVKQMALIRGDLKLTILIGFSSFLLSLATTKVGLIYAGNIIHRCRN